ncbi:MAG TPA: sulfatase [Candidatus Hydrogenedentes bacterium]|nr:sulfatase [Candidatus Hydrogenedentota bacterium]HPG67155.1 sulfatase [Candidatus Hydrogenedentota bacterium]
MTCVVLAAILAAPNVVFLSVDTLRADHLGCYGYDKPTSPNIDRLADESLVFEDCVCEVPLTAPSFGSMLTSLYPRMTGTTRNGLRMPGYVRTVAEIFREAGYSTFCVQSNWTLKADLFAIDRGFDLYDDAFHQKRWGVVNPERYADEVTDVALDRLANVDTSRPFFCWIHYSDPHAPYRFHSTHQPSGRPRFWLDSPTKARAKYDSEVAFADEHVGRLLAAIPRENTFILFVADHGESLYEHDYLGHGRRIYQTSLHIPLMVRGPNIEPGRTPKPARAIDVGTTLLALAGLVPAPGMLGRNILDADLPTSRPRVIETYGGAVPQLPGAKALMAERPPQRIGVLLDGWKLILDENQRPELFRIAEDPMEEEDLADRMADRVAALRHFIEEWDSTVQRLGMDQADLTKDDLEALKSLGYLE